MRFFIPFLIVIVTVTLCHAKEETILKSLLTAAAQGLPFSGKHGATEDKASMLATQHKIKHKSLNEDDKDDDEGQDEEGQDSIDDAASDPADTTFIKKDEQSLPSLPSTEARSQESSGSVRTNLLADAQEHRGEDVDDEVEGEDPDDDEDEAEDEVDSLITTKRDDPSGTEAETHESGEAGSLLNTQKTHLKDDDEDMEDEDPAEEALSAASDDAEDVNDADPSQDDDADTFVLTGNEVGEASELQGPSAREVEADSSLLARTRERDPSSDDDENEEDEEDSNPSLVSTVDKEDEDEATEEANADESLAQTEDDEDQKATDAEDGEAFIASHHKMATVASGDRSGSVADVSLLAISHSKTRRSKDDDQEDLDEETEAKGAAALANDDDDDTETLVAQKNSASEPETEEGDSEEGDSEEAGDSTLLDLTSTNEASAKDDDKDEESAEGTDDSLISAETDPSTLLFDATSCTSDKSASNEATQAALASLKTVKKHSTKNGDDEDSEEDSEDEPMVATKKEESSEPEEEGEDSESEASLLELKRAQQHTAEVSALELKARQSAEDALEQSTAVDKLHAEVRDLIQASKVGQTLDEKAVSDFLTVHIAKALGNSNPPQEELERALDLVYKFGKGIEGTTGGTVAQALLETTATQTLNMPNLFAQAGNTGRHGSRNGKVGTGLLVGGTIMQGMGSLLANPESAFGEAGERFGKILMIAGKISTSLGGALNPNAIGHLHGRKGCFRGSNDTQVKELEGVIDGLVQSATNEARDNKEGSF